MDNDLISRSALIKAVEQGEGISWERFHKDATCVRKKYIDNAPTVAESCKELQEVASERPQGEWIVGYTDKGKKVKKCDKCGFLSIQGKTKYCPNCGADMRGEEE